MLDSEHSPPSRERKTSMKVKKPPPLKKRHTKPCKFFQYGRCSNTAEECNFAHVLVLPGLSLPTPVAISPTAGVGGVCRYFSVGQCPGERVCGMRHVPDVNVLGAQLNQVHLGPSPTLSTSSSTPYAGTFAYPSPYTPYPLYYSTTWSQSTWGEQPSALPISNGGYSVGGHNYCAPETDSPSVSISASTDSSALSRLDTPADSGPVGALGLTGIGKTGASGLTCEGHAINAYPSHDHDDLNVVTEDPQFSEHAHNQHQSRIRVIDGEHSSAVSGYGFHLPSGGYPISQTPSWDAGGTYYYSQVTGLGDGDHKVSVTRSSSCASARSKSATRKYKTKPCRYFSAENGCPNGDNCTFIHDASIPPVPPIIRGHSGSPTSSGNGDDNAIHSSVRNHNHGGNVEKGISQDAEPGDNREKNFFPITWRVIGGGVLIGGKRPENPGGEEQRGVESHYGEPVPPKEPLIESCGNGVDDLTAEKKGFLKFSVAAPRPRSSSASTPIARPRTVIGVRRYNNSLFSAESP